MPDPAPKLSGRCGWRDGAQLARAVVLEGLGQLVAAVHHEGPVGGDRLADGLPAEDEHIQGRGAALLRCAGGEGDEVAGAQHGELPIADAPLSPTEPKPERT